MTGPAPRSTDLSVPVPTLEPDDWFVTQLAELAAAAHPGPAVAARPSGWRVGLAAASVAGITAGGALVAGAVAGHGSDDHRAPTAPASQPTPGATTSDHPRHPGPGKAPTADPASAPGAGADEADEHASPGLQSGPHEQGSPAGHVASGPRTTGSTVPGPVQQADPGDGPDADDNDADPPADTGGALADEPDADESGVDQSGGNDSGTDGVDDPADPADDGSGDRSGSDG